MARIGLTPTGKWHLLGKHGCRYVPDVEFEETRRFDERVLTDPEWGSVVAPEGNPDASWCGVCRQTLDDISSARYSSVVEIKARVPYRDVHWEPVSNVGDCEWCGKEDSATRTHDDLAVTVCPACAEQYNNPYIDVEEPPERDLRTQPPSEPVPPVQHSYYKDPEDRPSDASPPDESRSLARERAEDENRPYVEVAIKSTYADVVCDLTPTGFRFTTDAIDHIETRQVAQRATADDDPEHKSFVDRYVSDDRRRVQTRNLPPAAAREHAEGLAELARDPENWT